MYLYAMDVGIQHLVLCPLFWSIQAGLNPHCPLCEDEGKHVILVFSGFSVFAH